MRHILYDDENYGSINFTYYSFQMGEPSMPVPFIYGKLEVVDRKFPTVDCNPDDIDWSKDPPTCNVKIFWSERPWLPTDEFRVTLEFGEERDEQYMGMR